jgi:hypothetical protein
VNNNFIELTYKYGWGDCMSGCINNRYWKFRIFNDCSVLYEGSFGTPLGIQENQDTENQIRVYPNPAKDHVTIQGSGIKQVELLNLFGQIIANTDGENLILPLSDVPLGVYLIRVHYANRINILKLNKF